MTCRFFLAAPLVAWLFGSWLLLGTTVFYLCGVYLMEEDFLLGDEVRRVDCSGSMVELSEFTSHCPVHD